MPRYVPSVNRLFYAQTGDRFLVHLTDIQSIKQTLTERDYQNTGMITRDNITAIKKPDKRIKWFCIMLLF